MKIPDTWQYLGRGRHREAYRLPSGNVIKIPINDDGIFANRFEALAWKFRNQRERLHPFLRGTLGDIVPARCRMIPGTDLLVMEYVDACHGGDDTDWPCWHGQVDSYQFGYNKKEEFVAYDFANWYNYEGVQAAEALQEMSA